MKFTNEDRKQLIKIIRMEQEELHYYLMGRLEEYYGEHSVYTDNENYMFVKGIDSDIMLLAHLDTVHEQAPTEDEIFIDTKKGVVWSPVGIGGDDRCGVFNILKQLQLGHRPSILFSWNEEIGCVGSDYFSGNLEDADLLDYLQNKILFAIQIDRKGFSESVYYDLDNQDFKEYINSYGFETRLGSYTDICQVCPFYGFAGVNLSAGYMDEHTAYERIYYNEMMNTVSKVDKILSDVDNEGQRHYDYIGMLDYYPSGGYYEDEQLYGNPYGAYNYNYGWDSPSDDDDDEDLLQDKECSLCGGTTATTGVTWNMMGEDASIYDEMCDNCRMNYMKNLF